MRRPATIPCSITFALLLAGATAVARDAPPLKKWTQGPVRYVATASEMNAFKMLETDGARAGFIETFWLRRDPTPNTLNNESRQLFWERVRDANEMFTDRPGEGWKTDRGKILILHGPPTKIEDEPSAWPAWSLPIGIACGLLLLMFFAALALKRRPKSHSD